MSTSSRKHKLSDSGKDDGPSPSKSAKVSSATKKLGKDFYKQSCQDLAKALLGKKIVRKLDDGKIVAGYIVETEAYLGAEDKAAHSYEGKKSAKNEAMFMDPGTIYVYHIYGVMTCVNISSEGEGAAVLIRAVDPTDGMDIMKKSRGVKRADKGEGMKDVELGSGPSKLTQALHIEKATFNKESAIDGDKLWLENGFDVNKDRDIVVSSRIGVDYAKEWATKPLRFYVKGNKSVSKVDKEAESTLKKANSSADKAAAPPKPAKAKSNAGTNNSLDKDDRLTEESFQKPCEDLAKFLLGKKLVRELEDGELLAGHIVETEAYLGGEDKASHSYNGHKTSKNEAMFMDPGSLCVYNMYGTMTCAKISSQGEGAAVLIRGLHPFAGLKTMRKFRGVKRADKGENMKEEELGSGPSKLTQALNILRAPFNKEDIADCDQLWLQDGFEVKKEEIVACKRIGVDGHAGDWTDKPLRFYIKGNVSVSVRDKAAEK